MSNTKWLTVPQDLSAENLAFVQQKIQEACTVDGPQGPWIRKAIFAWALSVSKDTPPRSAAFLLELIESYFKLARIYAAGPDRISEPTTMHLEVSVTMMEEAFESLLETEKVISGISDKLTK